MTLRSGPCEGGLGTGHRALGIYQRYGVGCSYMVILGHFPCEAEGDEETEHVDEI
jgi:hypothetical protein